MMSKRDAADGSQQVAKATRARAAGRWYQRGRRLLTLLLRGCLLLILVPGFYLTVFPQGRAAVRAAFVLPALISASQPGILLAVGNPIQHTQRQMQSRSGPVYLDIYAPTTSSPQLAGARGGLLIVSGVGDNRQVPQLINLSEALARSGMVVMNMTTPTLMNYMISAQDSDATVQAFLTLQDLPALQGRRSGIIAFSGGVPLMCFAAADPRIRTQVASITAFGGYFDTRTLVHTFGSRSLLIDGKHEAWHPIAIPIGVLANMTTQYLSTSEQSSITAALAPQGAPLSNAELAQFSPGAQAIYHLLKGDQPQRVDANMAALPPNVQSLLDTLSPRRVLAQIQAPIFLLHDRNDASLPVTETRAFAAALTRLHHSHEYVEFHIFDHVEVRSGLQIGQVLGDGTQLFLLLDHLLSSVG
ncbi:alpha/beta hydrolase family protein [Dictyobacter arantiisoli]|uniref:Alpha/beta hydrolase n=1 Tax=Dictyobacter arantiisoli TaxID=2014874 RepID=A0A5A5THY0_9CHLR|nr:hypothetical protein [Dictyobacter arantiisoli]GCF10663.1 hypothetical protein KDI_42270 [Dictyobacter arantiisoli]